jgi:hypothetical protein
MFYTFYKTCVSEVRNEFKTTATMLSIIAAVAIASLFATGPLVATHAFAYHHSSDSDDSEHSYHHSYHDED